MDAGRWEMFIFIVPIAIIILVGGYLLDEGLDLVTSISKRIAFQILFIFLGLRCSLRYFCERIVRQDRSGWQVTGENKNYVSCCKR